MDYLATLAVIVSVSLISALALNIIVGYAGQLSMTQGALMGLGAYTVGVASTRLDINPALGIPMAAVVGGLVGLAFAAASIRLSDYDYVLVSLILQMMTIEVLRRTDGVTGGTSGLGGISWPEVFGLEVREPVTFAVLALLVVLIFGAAMMRIAKSSYALSLGGFRDSESSVAALGKNTTTLRLSVGLVAGVGAGLAGGLQASFLGFLTPTSFTEFLSILIIVYLLVGGMGSMPGAVLGVLLMAAVPEIVASFDFVSTAYQGPVQRVIYGAIIIGFVAFRPSGIVPERPIMRFGRGISAGSRMKRIVGRSA